MTKCPTCGRDDFTSRQYMRSHHKQAHGESIAGFEYTCEWCGESGVKSQINDRDEHQFCGQECYHAWRAENLVGENSPAWEGRKAVVQCDTCGVRTEKHMVNLEKRDNVFCSKECHDEHMAGRYKADRPQSDIPYGPNWEIQRERRLEKDGYECVACSISNAEHIDQYGVSLHVHHITPIRRFFDGRQLNYERANRLENLVTLCSSCHGRWEGIPLRPQEGGQ